MLRFSQHRRNRQAEYGSVGDNKYALTQNTHASQLHAPREPSKATERLRPTEKTRRKRAAADHQSARSTSTNQQKFTKKLAWDEETKWIAEKIEE